MSAKYFCDCCGAEIKDGVDRVRRVRGDVMIEIMVRYRGVWNGGGHVCHGCVINTVNAGRPARKNESWIDDVIKARGES